MFHTFVCSPVCSPSLPSRASGLGFIETAKLLGDTKHVWFKEGDTIFTEGDTSDSLYVKLPSHPVVVYHCFSYMVICLLMTVDSNTPLFEHTQVLGL